MQGGRMETAANALEIQFAAGSVLPNETRLT
jgi:hypothetical protein